MLSITTCQQTGLQEHLKAATYLRRVKNGNFLNFLPMGALDNRKWTYDGAFEWRFGSGRGGFEQFFSNMSVASGDDLGLPMGDIEVLI